MFKRVVEEIAAGTGVGGRIADVSAQVNSVVDAGSLPVAVRLCVGLGVVASALADMPAEARDEVSYRLIAALLGAEPVAGEASVEIDVITTAQGGPLAA